MRDKESCAVVPRTGMRVAPLLERAAGAVPGNLGRACEPHVASPGCVLLGQAGLSVDFERGASAADSGC